MPSSRAGALNCPGCTDTSADTGDTASIPTTKGTAGAYNLDGSEILTRRCPRRRRGYDIVKCGRQVREAAKLKICATKGKGSHAYKYRNGLGKITTSKVYCR